MMWILAGVYCFVLWLIFGKLRLLRFSLPIAIIAGSVGPVLILVFLFCAQYYHPYSKQVSAFQKVIPIVPQMKQAGRVTAVLVEPNRPVKRGEILFEVDRIPYENAVARTQAAVAGSEQGVKVAEASVETAAATLERVKADLEFATAERDRLQKLNAQTAATQQALDQAVARYKESAAKLNEAKVGQRAAELSVDVAKAQLEQSKTELREARYDLEQSTVIAPADGFVTNLQLQPGMLVGGAGAAAVMSFVEERSEAERGRVFAFLGQKNFLLVKPGQYAEVTFDAYPGQIFTGKVDTIIDASAAGQLTASGLLPENPVTGPQATFPVGIRLDRGDELRLPGGVRGCAAIYTDNVSIAGIPVMFLLRAQSWLNYLF